MTTDVEPTRTDVLVVGAGPAGSAAAAWAARAGTDVVLADAAVFPRDKTCGDGLTPRAMGELDQLGLGDWVRSKGRNRGLRAAGFGQELLLPWPGGLAARPRRCRPTHRARRPDPRRGPGRRRAAARGRPRGGRGTGRRPGDRGGVPPSRRVDGDGPLRPAGRGRRRPLPAGPGARPGVAPGHRLRRRRPRLHRLRPQRRRVDLLAPGAARGGRRAAVRLRLGLPAG
ncbi:protein of unknown function [Modestobacter italicus]|uniref:FAD-binding domain-containing protein n=1 Tax=Modestobacter italicus (strain DSM 44449 / CECT 9708 / BC 501) TaxID=2732864 RepID=I4EST6_MODI5|nr:protein of unknown function [Modestobacter marinus]